DFQVKIRPIEIGDDSGHPGPAQSCHYIVLDCGCCGCSDGKDRGTAQARQPLEECAIVRPKVMAPLADAVRLVDNHQVNLSPLYQSLNPGRVPALGSHIYQLVLASLNIGVSLAYRHTIDSAAEECAARHFAPA